MLKSLVTLFSISLLFTHCSQIAKDEFNKSEKFTTELNELKEYFQIPGLAVSIVQDGNTIYENYLGHSDLENQIALDSTSLFPIASITKVFSSILIMKLVEEEKISLGDPINKYLEDSSLSDSILVKHVLSHTSQGTIGSQFYYSSRFGLLTKVIEKASGKPFDQLMNESILEPLELEKTFLLNDSAQLAQSNFKIAKPYMLDNGIETGFIDFGYSASAGIVSNLNDLRILDQALNENTLISQESKQLMFTSSKKELPYAHGIFSQEFQGLKLVWAYGQYDCYSSLFLKVPSHNITLILLANNNLMSDPARLIYGNVTSSLFALSFLKSYIFEIEDMKLLEDTSHFDQVSFELGETAEFYKRKFEVGI